MSSRYRLCILPFLITSFLLTFVCSGQEFKSDEAAKLLEEIVNNYPESGKNSYELMGMNLRLMRMLFDNGQHDLAEKFADSREGHIREEVMGKLFVKHIERVADLAEMGSVDAKYLESVARVASKGSIVMANSNKAIERLMKTEQLDVAEQLIKALPGDLKTYKYRSGSNNNGNQKMHLVARLVKFKLIAGNQRASKQLLDLFGEEISREQAKLSVIANCYATEPIRADLAEDVYEWIETDKMKFWAAFRLGEFFAKQEDISKTLKYAKLMHKHYEQGSSRGYFGRLLLNLAQLQLNAGKSPTWAFDRFKEINKFNEDKYCYLAILAISGNTDGLKEKPGLISRVIDILTDFELSSRNISYSPMRFVDSKKQLETAIDLIEIMDNPYLRAYSLCKIAKKIIPVDPNAPKRAFHNKLTQRSFDVMDFDKAVWLADEAFKQASKESAPFVGNKKLTIDQSKAMQTVASLFMRLGKLSKATKAIEKISERVAAQQDSNSPGEQKKRSEKEQFIRYNGSSAASRDEPFTKNGGKAAFEFIEMLTQFDHPVSRSGLHAMTSKFSKLGSWDKAEKAFDIINEKYDQPVYIPTKLVHDIAKDDDIERLKKWRERCSPETLASFLDSFCGYCTNNRKLPSRHIMIEIDSIRDEVAGERSYQEIDTLLLVGFWADEMNEQVDKQFKRLLDKRRRVYLSSVAKSAMSFGFPELAVKVAEKIEGKDTREETLLSFHRLGQNAEFNSDMVQDENWMKAQSAEVQTSLKMRKAKKLLKTLNGSN